VIILYRKSTYFGSRELKMTSGITCNFLVDGAFVRFLKDCQLASHPIKNQLSYD
jgi:hypothetical protein